MNSRQQELCLRQSQRGSADLSPSRQLKLFAAGDIKVLLLENVNEAAPRILEGQGYQIEFIKTSLSEAELIEKAR